MIAPPLHQTATCWCVACFECQPLYPDVSFCAAQVDSAAVQVKFFERQKGRVFHHPSSVNFNCGRFESGWLIYTDMVETAKVSRQRHFSRSYLALLQTQCPRAMRDRHCICHKVLSTPRLSHDFTAQKCGRQTGCST